MSALPCPGAACQVRPMRIADLDPVVAIENRIYPFPWTRGNFKDSLVAGYDGWVIETQARAADRLIGYAIVMWLLDEVHLLNLSVAGQQQGQGNGRRLLEWLCRDAIARGAFSMLLEVRPSNAPALALYASSGFERVGLRRDYYPDSDGRREDALVMRKVFSNG